jgi:ribosome-associated protein
VTDRAPTAPGPASSALADRLATLVGGTDAIPIELSELAEAVLERNAREALVLDLREISDATDFFVIASGDSDVHTRAIAENVLEKTRRAGVRPAGVEGKATGRWILIDFISVVLHIFLPKVRDFYQLERLWGDAPQVSLDGL